MNLGILPNLTKDYILSKVSQEQIFEHYLPIKVTTEGLIKSPLRNDKNPTASFYYSQNGKLRFRDFGGNFWGDCFDLVALYENLNANNKKDFNILLDKLARIFKIHKYESNGINPVISGNTLSIKEASINFKGKKKIEIKTRDFNEIDARFWFQGNVTRKYLKKLGQKWKSQGTDFFVKTVMTIMSIILFANFVNKSTPIMKMKKMTLNGSVVTNVKDG